MSELHTRKEKRTPVTLKIKFKSATLDQFIERYSVDVSHGGIFIRTKDPLAVGTQLRFEFQLQDASPLISGDGTVVWTREFDPSRVGVAPGMGVRFDRLAPESQPVLEQILSRKAGGPASRELDRFEGAGSSSQPGLQGEKTRITPPTLASSLAASSRLPSQPSAPAAAASAPVVRGGLAGLVPPRGGFADEQSKDATPLPKPMPFNVGGEDEFSEDVFEQPTKVASLEVLLKHEEEHARKAQAEALAAAAEKARQQQQLRGDLDEDEQTEVVAKPAGERHRSRPDIRVVPPVAARPPEDETPRPGTPQPKLTARPVAARPVPTMPPARVESVDEPTPVAAKPSSGPAPSIHEPRFLEAGRPHVHVPSELVATTPSRNAGRPSPATERTAAKRSSPVGIILGAVVFIAAAAALWFFVIRPGSDEEPTVPRGAPAGSALQEPARGPRDPARPAAVPAPAPAPAKKGKLIIAATPATAQLAVDGAAPGAVATELELEAGRHQLAFHAPCHKDETVTVEVKGDETKEVNAKLKPLDRVVRVSTEPAGATLVVDGKPAGKTPTDVRLIGRLDPRAEHTFIFRKPGYDEAQTVVPPDAACATDGDVAVVGLRMTLTAERTRPAAAPARNAPKARPQPTRNPVRPAPVAAPPPKPEPVPAPGPASVPGPGPGPGKEESKAEPVKAEPKPEPAPAPVPAKEEPKDSFPVKEEPKPEPAKPAAEPAPKAEPKDCDPSPDAPEWAKCK